MGLHIHVMTMELVDLSLVLGDDILSREVNQEPGATNYQISAHDPPVYP